MGISMNEILQSASGDRGTTTATATETTAGVWYAGLGVIGIAPATVSYTDAGGGAKTLELAGGMLWPVRMTEVSVSSGHVELFNT